jgi:hypothetical protein
MITCILIDENDFFEREWKMIQRQDRLYDEGKILGQVVLQ